MPAVKEPVSLMRDDNKRPDGTTRLPWTRGKPMAWDVTVLDQSINQSINQSILKWAKWHNHCEDHRLGEVSKLHQDMIAGVKNVLTVDKKLTVYLLR